jgi:hypothetical protein
MDVRGEPLLGFDGSEVLQVVAKVAAQVLDEPVEQRGEGQGIAGSLVVVVGLRVGGCSVLADPAVGRAGQRDKQRRPEGLAARGGIGLSDRARADLAARQVRGVLTAPGGPVPPRRFGGGGFPADTRAGDLIVQFGNQLVKVGRVSTGSGGTVTLLLGFRRISLDTEALT